MPAVYFIMHSGRLFGKRLEWLVTSIDTDQRIIVLLAMSSGCIVPQGFDTMPVTAACIVNCGPRYILMNRVYSAIGILSDESESESAWAIFVADAICSRWPCSF